MLSDALKQFYRDNGYLLVQNLITKEEAAEYRAECHAVATRLTARNENIDATWGSARAIGSPPTQILNCHDIQFHSALFGRLIVDRRFTECASDVMGTPNVQLHHTKMFIKPAETGSPFPLHQDHPYFPHRNHSMIAAIIHLDDAPLEKGCLRVVPGSHKLGPLKHAVEGGWHLPPESYPLESAVPCPAKAGDAIFFSYLTIHGSGLNTSNEPRTTMLIQLRDPSDIPELNTHKSRGQGMMLRGINSCASPHAPPE